MGNYNRWGGSVNFATKIWRQDGTRAGGEIGMRETRSKNVLAEHLILLLFLNLNPASKPWCRTKVPHYTHTYTQAYLWNYICEDPYWHNSSTVLSRVYLQYLVINRFPVTLFLPQLCSDGVFHQWIPVCFYCISAQATRSMVVQYSTDLQMAVSHASNTCWTNKCREEDNETWMENYFKKMIV